MGQMLVRNLDETVKHRLRLRASRNGRSVEAEAREILSAAVADPRGSGSSGGLGTRITARFATAEAVPLDVAELDWGPAHPAAID